MGGAPGAELTCACGATGTDPAGWERSDFEDRCPECRSEDPAGDGEVGSSAGFDESVVLALGAVGNQMVEEEAEKDAEKDDEDE